MTDPGRLARRAQLAVLLDRADRLTVDEAALLRTLVTELAEVPVRITGDPMPQPQTCDASVISHLTDPPAMVGPCILRHGHDGPAHKAANGTSWTAMDRPRGSRLLIDDRTAERRTEQPEFIEVASYRTDAGRTAWAMRCWGDGTCDGLISLDHDTERWAVVARDRHLADAHTTTTPQAGQPQADGPLVLDRAAAIAMRDCLNQLLGDEPAVKSLRERYAAALAALDCSKWETALPGEDHPFWNVWRATADAVLAVRDDEVARLRAELEAQRATPRELELRQRRERVAAGRCPMCGRADTDGRLCGDCASTVRALPSHNRRQWRRYEPPNPYPPIQGPGYTPAGLLGMDLDDSPQER